MNCKPGDLAYVVAGVNEGRVVTVAALAAQGWLQDGPLRLAPCSTPRWHVEGCDLRIVSLSGGIWGGLSTRVIRDEFLRPISGVPLADEVHDEVAA
ncbi:hypothetical protein [Paraburkholderia unamae]|uniref:Uncharacterized protein n=1 Tax=Paraburkholderia unamae TaxID=219649 RepID=A0ABX5KUK6_9BURK|nr:hypothetical protein [Paraburkholderia unamae]PVX84334.1 hypothetical protein C7402_105175 [Paraburkholderia unamae]